LFIATTAAFLAAAYYAHVARLQRDVMAQQWETMKDTLAETRKQAVASAASAQAAHDANAITLESTRARIERRNTQIDKAISIGNPIQVVSYFENVGHSAAFDVRAGFAVKRWHGLPDGAMPILVPPEGITLETGSPGHQVYMSDAAAVTADFIKGLPPIRKERAVEGKELTAYFFGRFDYSTFGQEHHTEFCFYVTKFDSSGLPVSVQSVEPHYTLMRCSKWNRSD
jgi:hypothetical protein